MPEPPPGAHEITDAGQLEFVAGALMAGGVMPIAPDSPIGKIAAGLAVAVPVDEQPELDRLLAGRERGDDVVLDITSRWSVLGMPDGLVLARLDLVREGKRSRILSA